MSTETFPDYPLWKSHQQEGVNTTPFAYARAKKSALAPDVQEAPSLEVADAVHSEAVDTVEDTEMRAAEPIETPDPEVSAVDPSPNEPIQATTIDPDHSFVWEIPGDRQGYNLRLVVPGPTLDEARYQAGETLLPDGLKEDNTPRGRRLNQIEAHWVQSTEPKVVRRQSDIALDWNSALLRNDQLSNEIAAIEETQWLFHSLSIDPSNPQSWVDDVKQRAEDAIDTARQVDERNRRALQSGIRGMIDHMREVEKMTGFAVPDPAPETEPDYSRLIVVYPDADTMDAREHLYPKLKDAMAISRMVGEPMSEQERAGKDLVRRVLEDHRFFKASPTEAAAVAAYVAYVETRIDAD